MSGNPRGNSPETPQKSPEPDLNVCDGQCPSGRVTRRDENPSLWSIAELGKHPSPVQSALDGFDPDDYDESWRGPLSRIAAVSGVTVEPGTEVLESDRVVGLDLASVSNGRATIRLIDDSRSTAAATARALEAQGHTVLRVDGSEVGMAAKVLSALRNLGGGGSP